LCVFPFGKNKYNLTGYRFRPTDISAQRRRKHL
jgi:hypothetical protein